MDKKVSIIIRTKDEERWIAQCLNAVAEQEYKAFDVIIVDNQSSDKTVEKASHFKYRFGGKLKVITCKEYLPGRALNMGIRESGGDLIACLSGHCIPVNGKWLTNLVKGFEASDIAGVYGRQEAMTFTPDRDKRDLNLVFGLDRKVQKKDSFFHNANSMIRRDIWKEVPFDETLTNIEDRAWAKEIIEKGYKIIYEPESSVYHYHGIHQNGNEERCANVVRILESLHSEYSYKSIDIEKLNIVAIIPVKGEIKYFGGKPLISYTIRRALESKYIKRVIVATDNEELSKLACELGAEVPFLRDASLSEATVDLDKVLSYSLNKIENLKIFPDLVVSMEITFPFRPQGLIDDIIVKLAQSGFDSVIAAKSENKAIWKEKDGDIVQLDEGLTPREFKDPTFVELRGVACATHPEFLRKGSLLGSKIGIYEMANPYSHLEVRTDNDINMWSFLAKEWFR